MKNFELTYYAYGAVTQDVEIDDQYDIDTIKEKIRTGEFFTTIQNNGDVCLIDRDGEITTIGKVIDTYNELEFENMEIK